MNRVRELRVQRGLTQQSLAEAVGATRDDIRRIEEGRIAHLRVVLQLCRFFEEPIPVIFPETEEIVRQHGLESVEDLMKCHGEVARALAYAGVDPDPAFWTLKVEFTSGKKRYYRVSSLTIQRFNAVANDGTSPMGFFVFEAEDREVAINLERVLSVHTLFDGDACTPRKSIYDEVEIRVRVRRRDIRVHVDADGPVEFEEEDEGPVREFVQALELPDGDEPFISIVDVDGERAFFRRKAVEVIEVPLGLVSRVEHDHPEFHEFAGASMPTAPDEPANANGALTHQAPPPTDVAPQ